MNSRLEEEIAKILIENKYTISTAESCSGGLLAHRLTNIPGSSRYFQAGFIVYTAEAKQKILKIDKALLKKYGTISRRTALAMAKNASRLNNSKIGLSITGVAGPQPLEGKPVGEVYIGLAIGVKTWVKKVVLSGTRKEIKYQATNLALNFLKKNLSKRK